MAFCDNCGHELRSKSKFCGSCGEPTELIEDTPKTHRSNPFHTKILIGVSIPVVVVVGIYLTLTTSSGSAIRQSGVSIVYSFH